MFVCPGLDDTADAACDNLVELENQLCHDCAAETLEIYARLAAVRKDKEAYADRREDTRDWARLKPMYKVSLPVQQLVLALFCLLMEAFVRPCLQ